jgi:hypothetical protein
LCYIRIRHNDTGIEATKKQPPKVDCRIGR